AGRSGGRGRDVGRTAATRRFHYRPVLAGANGEEISGARSATVRSSERHSRRGRNSKAVQTSTEIQSRVGHGSCVGTGEPRFERLAYASSGRREQSEGHHGSL